MGSEFQVMNYGYRQHVDFCQRVCAAMGSTHAGLQAAFQCFCGSFTDEHDPSTGCNMPCSADGNRTCGGNWAVDVYKISKKKLWLLFLKR